MPNSQQIVYLSQAQYDELVTNESITVDGVTVEYNENDIYVTPQIESGIIKTITGTTPVIVGVPNTCYVCGEVSSINIVPPSTGMISVRFTTDTTPTILTLPSTVIMPEWFDSTNLEAGRTYEINIADGIYGVVMSWPA